MKRAPNPMQALVESYAANERMNQDVIEQLDPRAWQAKPPAGSARTVAAIFSHVHNIRRKWLRLSAPHIELPAALHRAHCTPEQTRAALAESAARCADMLTEALVHPTGRVANFHRDGWAKPWPADAAMAAYMITHEAHHRGQVCLLAHQLGFPLSKGYRLWEWKMPVNTRAAARPRPKPATE